MQLGHRYILIHVYQEYFENSLGDFPITCVRIYNTFESMYFIMLFIVESKIELRCKCLGELHLIKNKQRRHWVR